MSQKVMMVTGFPGAGKTTTIINTARILKNRGISSAVVTADHGSNLVDTNLFIMEGIPVLEVPNGISGDDFTSLAETLDKLTKYFRPEIIFVEIPGDNAGLSSKIVENIGQQNDSKYSFLPLTTIVDPQRNCTNEKTAILYRALLEEAELIVINKTDTADEDNIKKISESIGETFPAKTVCISALTHQNMEDWCNALLNAQNTTGENCRKHISPSAGCLEWYNLITKLVTVKQYNFDDFAAEFMGKIQNKLQAEKLEIAHLKVMCIGEDGYNYASLVSSDAQIHFSNKLNKISCCTTINISVKAAAKSEKMAEIVEATLKECADSHIMRCKNMVILKP